MHVCYDARDLPERLRGAVLALGNFDGVHRGHQAVLGRARMLAQAQGAPVGVMVFHPHPRQFFQPDKHLFRLTPLEVKLELLQELGLDLAVVMTFDAAFAALSADEFIDEILLRRLGISHAVAGFDFHFGKARAGSPELLRQAGAARGFGVTIVEAVAGGEGLFSSSAVRKHLEAGEAREAARQLGYWWFARGTVIKGDQRGRDLGYPTANMALPAGSALAHGIYAVRVRRLEGGRLTSRDGVASFGVRPTFGGGNPLLETFIFDFSGDLYGETIEVELVGFIRPEAKFDTVAALIARMDEDSAQARAILAAAAQGEPIGDLARVRAGETA